MPFTKKFDVLYYKDPRGKGKEFSHKYSEPWELTDYFCPNCGKKGVWFRNDSGDYYVGEQYICIECEHTFYLPDGVSKANDEQDTQRLKALKA